MCQFLFIYPELLEQYFWISEERRGYGEGREKEVFYSNFE